MTGKYGDHWQETHAIEVFAEPLPEQQLALAVFISPTPRAYANLCAKLLDRARAVITTFEGHDVLTHPNPDSHQ